MRNDLKAAIRRAIMLQWGWTDVHRDRRGKWWGTGTKVAWDSRPLWTDKELEDMVRTGELKLDQEYRRKVGQSYEQMRAAGGEAWADRLWAHQEHGMPDEPPGPSFMHGCPKCAGYGKPGWVVQYRKAWAKCPGCNGESVDNTGREVYK